MALLFTATHDVLFLVPLAETRPPITIYTVHELDGPVDHPLVPLQFDTRYPCILRCVFLFHSNWNCCLMSSVESEHVVIVRNSCRVWRLYRDRKGV